MSAEIVPQRRSSTSDIIASFATEPKRVNLDSLMLLYRASRVEGDAFLEERAKFDAAIDALSDDQRKVILIEQRQLREEMMAKTIEPIDWVGAAIENSLFRSLSARRQESGTSKVSIPDPYIDIELAATFAYDPDVDALELIAQDLPANEAAKLVTVIPERDEPEHTVVVPAKHVPRQVTVGATVSILAIMKRYAGSPIAAAIDAAMGRKLLSERLTVKPRAAAPQSAKAPSRAHEVS